MALCTANLVEIFETRAHRIAKHHSSMQMIEQLIACVGSAALMVRGRRPISVGGAQLRPLVVLARIEHGGALVERGEADALPAERAAVGRVFLHCAGALLEKRVESKELLGGEEVLQLCGKCGDIGEEIFSIYMIFQSYFPRITERNSIPEVRTQYLLELPPLSAPFS